jgi:hypothetical protein
MRAPITGIQRLHYIKSNATSGHRSVSKLRNLKAHDGPAAGRHARCLPRRPRPPRPRPAETRLRVRASCRVSADDRSYHRADVRTAAAAADQLGDPGPGGSSSAGFGVLNPSHSESCQCVGPLQRWWSVGSGRAAGGGGLSSVIHAGPSPRAVGMAAQRGRHLDRPPIRVGPGVSGCAPGVAGGARCEHGLAFVGRGSRGARQRFRGRGGVRTRDPTAAILSGFTALCISDPEIRPTVSPIHTASVCDTGMWPHRKPAPGRGAPSIAAIPPGPRCAAGNELPVRHWHASGRLTGSA